MVYTHLRASVMACIVLCQVSAVFAYSGGSGTADDPYQIGTVADWNDLMNTPSDWDANFIMTADINLQDVPLIPVGNDINGTYLRFDGIFDGNGHTIRNASINMPGYWHIGLFGVIDTNSQIRNLGVEDVNMRGERDIAGLAGYSKGTIINCFATGKIGFASMRPTGANLGGLVGYNLGTITGSYAICDINGISMRTTGMGFGGLVGRNLGNIYDCYAGGMVIGNKDVGGLVGENYCAYDEMTGGNSQVGTIKRCFSNGTVTGGSGLVGINGDLDYMFMGLFATISDCYSTATIKGGAGLVSKNYGKITNCYAAGKVNGNGSGLVGSPVPPLINCFWDIEATGQTTSGSGTGKTTAEMMTLSTFTSAGWDFVDETANGPNDIWFIREGKEYPRFVWENNKPVADAGQDQTVYAWIDGIAEVTLDANNSYDADGDELTYLWSWSIDGNSYDTNSIDPTIELPIGVYTVELVVNDGLADSEPSEVVITVIEPVKSTLCIVPKVINGRANDKRIMAMLRLPAGITRKQIDPGQKLLLYPGEIESSFQFVLPCGQRDVERLFIIAYFDKAELMDAVGKAGRAQLNVVGQLKTGQYYYGCDTVWIIYPPPRTNPVGTNGTGIWAVATENKTAGTVAN